MKTQFLISHRYKYWGWPLLIIGIVWSAINIFGEYEPDFLKWPVPALWDDTISRGHSSDAEDRGWLLNNVADELGGLTTLLGALLLLLAREKNEDELITKVRLESLLWAAIINALANLAALLFIYGIPYFHVMIVNMVFFYLLFVVRFHWALSQYKNTDDDQ